MKAHYSPDCVIFSLLAARNFTILPHSWVLPTKNLKWKVKVEMAKRTVFVPICFPPSGCGKYFTFGCYRVYIILPLVFSKILMRIPLF